ncbi:MAG: DUF4838 domain-containing protein, partial [Clostridia bacterium]|nr:DUF4838 domain-containing protein [Clostridia bacterium]
MKKLLILVLVAALLLPCLLTACNPSQKPEETTLEQNTTPEVTTPEPDDSIVPEVETMKLTSIKVTTGDTQSEIFAGAELMAYLSKQNVTVAEDGFPISISIDPTLDEDGFLIEASFEENRGMTFKGSNERGVLYAVYRFLEKFAGFRYFTPELETFTPGDVVIPEGVVMDYAPVMSTARRLTWYYTGRDAEWCVKNGISGCDTTLDAMHGGPSLNYGSMFVHTIGPLYETTYPYPTYTSNPCLTDPEILATVIKNVRKELEKNPAMNIISVSQTDVESWCLCPNCARIAEEEGSYAGVWVRFVNTIAEDIAEDYPNVIVDTLAYKHTQTPPKITKPRENVCIRLCSIECCFTHALDDPNCPDNKKFHDDLVGWGKICDNIHVWDYTTNFHYYISTFANLFTIRENMRFYAENNVVSMFPQGNSQGWSGEFGELRSYLLAQLMWNPYMSEEEYNRHMNEFLEAYYGAGWTFVREYIDITSRLAKNGGYKLDGNENPTNAVCGQGIYDHPLTVITRQEYFNYELRFDECWTLAEELAGDRKEFVHRSALQWRLAKLYLHPNATEAAAFIAEAKALGVVWKEGQPNVQSSSDLSLSPYY